MNVSYSVLGKTYTYEQKNFEEESKLNCLLTSLKGDFLMLGLNTNSTKFQGMYFCQSKDFIHYKILDEIIVKNHTTKKVENNLDSFSRVLFKDEVNKQAKDSFFMSPTGDVIYSLENSTEEAFLDFDCHRFDDFDEWGRNYSLEKINDVYLIKFEKKKGEEVDYSLFVGLKSMGGTLKVLQEWIKKEYCYSKRRGSSYQRYVFRFGSFKTSQKGKVFLTCGDNKEEVIRNLQGLTQQEENIRGYLKTMKDQTLRLPNFRRPLSYENSLTYTLSVNSMYSFVVNSIQKENLREGLVAGYPWFAQVWNRDELVSLKGYMNLGEDDFIKKRLDYYFLMIDSETGLLRRLQSEDSLASCDGVFWLAKRFEEFVFHIDSIGRLNEFYSAKELRRVYNVFKLSFEKIIGNFWDSDDELIRVKHGDSWMDTIQVEFPLDIQVQFLSFLSAISSLAAVCGSVEDAQKFLDFEELFKAKIRDAYFRHGFLFDEPHKDRLTVNVFLAYYTYPDLFVQGDWENIFDRTLNRLKTSWGGLSSLSKKDKGFFEEYTGEDNRSYHNGDSWFFMNHIAAISMSRVSEKKYREVIQGIIKSSANDILKMGTLGFCSEISSAKEQRAEGCFAQLWSSATFVELIDELNGKEF